MTDVIEHRGPDGEGFYVDHAKGVGLGHRRLTIVDPSSAGHQPMTYENSGYWIVCNGEIYNYIELQLELKKLGYKFYTQSDTEVLLAAYCAWGTEGFKKLNGMFAFAIYDKHNHEVLLCRDRYGVKPLLYWYQDNQLIFGSELKVFAVICKKIKLGWNETAIRTKLVSPNLLDSSGHTLFEHVDSLMPGHFILIKKDHLTIKKWWDTLDHLVKPPQNMEDQIEQFTYLFNQACQIRAPTGVSTGASLSGGLDSSSIVSTLSNMGYPIKTFNHLFDNNFLDEREYVNAIVAANQIDCSFIKYDSAQMNKYVDHDIYHSEDFKTTLLPTTASRIFRAQCAHGIKVSIDGHGADELLGGYYWYLAAARRDCSLFSRRLYYCLNQQKKMGGYTPPHFYKKELFKKFFPRIANYNQSSVFPELDRNLLEIHSDDIYREEKLTVPAHWSYLQSELYRIFHGSLFLSTLKSIDLVSMQYGIEVRMPFLDYRLVNFCFSLPDKSKIDNGFSKLILREAMKKRIPEKVRMRKMKIPLSNVPVKNLLRNEMRGWVEEVLEDANSLEGIVSLPKMKNFYFNTILSNDYDGTSAGTFCSYLNAMRLINLFKRNFDI